jgi:hypothetical protein
LQHSEGQMNLLEEPNTARLRQAFRSVDHIRNRFGESSISLAKTLNAGIRERVHENPFDLPGKAALHQEQDDKQDKDSHSE